MATIDRVAIKVTPDLSGFRDKVRRELSKIEEASLKLAPDRSYLRRKTREAVKDARDDAQRMLKRSPLELKIQVPEAQRRKVAAMLAVLSRRRVVDIVPKVNQSALARASATLGYLTGLRSVHGIISRMGDALKGLDKSLPIIGSIGLAIMNIGALALTSASNLFALSQSLAAMLGAGLAAPGILGGLAIGLGVTIVALKDMDKYIPDVVKGFSNLKDVIGKNFWAAAAKPFTEMANKVLPILNDRLASTSKAIGGYFGGLATAIQGTLAPALTGMFNDLDTSVRIATKGTKGLVGVITTLGTQGAGMLPRLAEWFVRITDNFDRFLETAAKDGRLQEWIDQGIFALSELGRVAREAGGILGALGSIAQEAGGSTLSMLADTLDRIGKVLNTPSVRDGLVGALMAAHQAMGRLADAAGPGVQALLEGLSSVLTRVLPTAGGTLGQAIGAIASALSQIQVQDALVGFFQGLSGAVTALAPAMAPLARALAAIASAIGAVLPPFARLLASALTPLAGIIERVAPLVGQLASALMDGLGGVLDVVGPKLVAFIDSLVKGINMGAVTAAIEDFFGTIADYAPRIFPIIQEVLGGLGGLFSSLAAGLSGFNVGGLLESIATNFLALARAIAPLLPKIGELVGSLLPPLANLIGTVAQQLPVLIAGLAPIVDAILDFAQALTPLVTAVADFASAALPKLVTAVVGLLGALRPIIDALTALWNVISPLLIPVLEFLANLLLDTVVMAVNGVKDVITGLIEVLTGLYDFFVGTWVGLFTGDWTQAWEGIKSIAQGLWDLIKGAFELLLSIGILSALRKGLLLIKGLWTQGWSLIKTLGEILWNGIKAAFGAFMIALKDTPGKALAAIRAAFRAAWTLLRAEAIAAWELLKTTISWQIDKIVSVVKTIGGKILDAVKGFPGLLKDSGVKLIQGLIDGISGMIGTLLEKVGGLAGQVLGKVKGVFGIHSPSREAHKIGDYFSQGLGNGIEGRFDSIYRSVVKFGRKLSGVEIDAPGINDRDLRSYRAGLSDETMGLTVPGGDRRTFIYNAAPGDGSSEEDIFAASERARFVW